MTVTVLRKELHSIIDTMPEHFIRVMMPLLACITEEYWKPVIEPASPDEIETLGAEDYGIYYSNRSNYYA
jgi:hypothetical protein